ncbi:LOG family protein [Heyndrickxia acidicola]|uniref:LOG family protein n=1 Tax=Heyndrickxia acidicola TaxID=209389 RepID=A0ABU6MN63_9BACI|nr:LOG family protein [Heyndrickxia acidicola]MED1205754.1 LOG family protein [Heyndrickxia acidicola]
MKQVELIGSLFYEPSTHTWSASGTGWRIEKTDGNKAKITFEEPITFNPHLPSKTNTYNLSISSLGENGQVHTSSVEEDGFIVTWKDISSNDTCMAAFRVIGTQVCFIPNDRSLGTEDSIADIYAAELLFSYEAKFGVVTLMGSGTINSKELTEERIKALSLESEKLLVELNKEEDTFCKDLLKEKMAKNKLRMKRQKEIAEHGSVFWDSAFRFGELWGRYSANDQEDSLGGCYVPLCTGGGPGIMRAAAEGARSHHAHVIGIDCQFGVDDFFNLKNTYSVFSNQRLRMNNFSIRESVLINYSHVILFWPGGFGTVWEVFETLSKLQTNHLRRHRTKAIFVHSEYWKPFFDCIEQMRKHGAINAYGDRIKIPGVDDQLPDEAYIAEVVESPEEAFEKTRCFVESLYQKNQLTLKS